MANKSTPNKLAISEAQLRNWYWGENLSQWKIAIMLGVTQGAIYYWMRKFNIPARPKDDFIRKIGSGGHFKWDKNPRWNGGRHLTHNGYVSVRDPKHPLADNRGYIREHRLVWYEANGPIPIGWHIHHKNGDKTDNKLENLELMTHRAHRAVLPNLLKKINELEQRLKETVK